MPNDLRPGDGFGRRAVYEDEHEHYRETVAGFLAAR